MNNFVTDAINLKSYNLSESDKIVVMYSKDKGLIKGVAKGVKKPKSKLGARMDLLVANKLMLYKGKSMDRICQADVLNTFNKTRRDMDKIFYSMYVSEIVNSFGVEDDPCSKEIYELLYKTLEHISEAQNKTEMLLACLKFQLKMMQISGFGIELDTCLCCKNQINEDNMFFSSNMGGVVCTHCNELHNIKTKHLTNEDIAELTGIPETTVSRIISGSGKRPSNENVMAIAAALDISVDKILYTVFRGEEPPKEVEEMAAGYATALAAKEDLIAEMNKHMEGIKASNDRYRSNNRKLTTVVFILGAVLCLCCIGLTIYLLFDAFVWHEGFFRR